MPTTGSTTAKLTTYVPTDACSTTMKYYCVVTLTDSDGNVLKTSYSDDVELTASHVYDDCDPVPGTTSGTLWYEWGGHVVHVGYDNSDKHQYYCHGEGDCGIADPHGTAKSHTYGDPVLFQASNTSNDPDDFVSWYRYTCTECGHKHYVKKHVHNFEVPDDYLTNEDSMAFLGNNCTAETHPMRCTVEGCSAISHEKHEFMMTSYGYPEKDSDGVITYGSYTLECKQCGYTLSGQELEKANSGRWWGGNSTLVVAKDAAVEVYQFSNFTVLKANSLARPGETVLLIPTQQNGRKITDWTVEYTDYTHGEYTTTVTLDSLEVSRNEDGSWYFTMRDFSEEGEHDNGGRLYLAPTYDENPCDHSCGTMLVNDKAAVCMNEGYTGDTVCKDCGQILDVDGVGDIIPANADHTGTWKLIEGTAVTANCRHRGYTGDFKCSACGEIKAGTKTGYKHGATVTKNKVEATCSTNGYTGDVYCTVCNKKILSGRALPLNASKHGSEITVDAYDATCLSDGSTGTKKCADCGATLQEASKIPALGHSWGEGEVTKEPTTTEPGTMTYHCTHEWTVTLRRAGAIGGSSTVTRQCNGTRTVTIPALNTPTIDSVALTVAAPAVGSITAAAATTSTGCTVANTSWLDEDGDDVPLGRALTYIIKVELEASGNYAFTPDTTFTLNGENVTVVTRGLDSVTLTYTFPTVTTDPTPDPDPDPIIPPYIPVKPVTPVKPTEPETPAFPDVLPGIWYEDAVNWAADEGITTGTPDGLFDPDGLCNRAQAVTFLWRAAGCPAPQSTVMPFDDVKADSYYYNAVLWAVENGITKGTSDTTFSPELACDRAQIVTLLYRFAQLLGKDVSVGEDTNILSYADATSIPDYAFAAMQWGCGTGVLQGDGVNLMPTKTCTRAQIVSFIYRCMK